MMMMMVKTPPDYGQTVPSQVGQKQGQIAKLEQESQKVQPKETKNKKFVSPERLVTEPSFVRIIVVGVATNYHTIPS